MGETAGYEVSESVRIPMPDGIHLSARLWLPAAAVPVPVVLELIPYRKRDAYRDADDAWGAVLAAAGIAFARVDVRGTGDSEGVLVDEYSETELADGETCIDWLAAQDWCNGRVGMRGISWGGINTLMIAARAPAALKAIVPMAAADDRFTDDAHYIGGLIGKANLDWGVLFKTVLAGPPDPEVVGDDWLELWKGRLAATPAVVTRWLQHPTSDAYWQRGSVRLDPDTIRVPAYLVAGWQDTYVNFVERLFRTLSVPVRALIGPWGHTYPAFARPQSLDWATEEVAWWRRWLSEPGSEPSDCDAEPPLVVHLPVETARQRHPEPVRGEWLRLSGWPDSHRRFALEPGRLTTGTAEGAEDIPWRESEPVGGCTAEWLDGLPMEQTSDDGVSLCFDSDPLTEDLVLLGRPRVTLSLKLLSGTIVTARLTELDEAGHSWLISYATLDLRFRKGFEQPEPVDAGEPLELALELRLAGHRFRAGNRLRLALSGGLWPMTWPAEAATELLLKTADCVLELPVLTDDEDAAAEAVRQFERRAEPPAPLPPVIRTPEGDYRYESARQQPETRIAATGTTLGGKNRFLAELGPDRYSRWQAGALRRWQRPGWDCEVAAEVTLTRSADGLRIEESLSADLNGERIFERSASTPLASASMHADGTLQSDALDERVD